MSIEIVQGIWVLAADSGVLSRGQEKSWSIQVCNEGLQLQIIRLEVAFLF